MPLDCPNCGNPTPPKPRETLAFESWLKTQTNPTPEQAWMAGVEWRKANP